MANYTLTDLLLFSAGAMLVNFVLYIYIYISKESGLYELGRWRQPLPWHFSMQKKNE